MYTYFVFQLAHPLLFLQVTVLFLYACVHLDVLDGWIYT